MKLIKFFLASAFLNAAVHCSVSDILSNDRHGAAESIFSARTVDDAMYDDILNSTKEVDIKNYFSKLGGAAVSIHAPSILLKAISKGNKVAVYTLITLGADPFKMHQMYKMTAWDFLSVIPESELNPGQREIKANLHLKYMELPEMRRTRDAEASMARYSLLYFARFAEFETFNSIAVSRNLAIPNITFIDGSSPLHQCIIGNHINFCNRLLNTPELSVNKTWENKPGVSIDIKEQANIDPVGWTALMIAIAFDRVEMIRMLLERTDIDIYVKAGGFDAFTLARRLPVKKQEIVLPLLKGKVRSAAASNNYIKSINMAKFVNLKMAIEDGAPLICLSFYLYKETVNLETLKSAVTHITDETIFNEILREAENIFKTDRSINKHLWAALKLDTKSGTVDKFKAKIAILISYGFKIDERASYVDAKGGMTPLEEAYTSANLKHELALAVILNSPQVNLIEGQNVPIILAIKNDKADIVNYLLKNARSLGLNFELDCNPEKENLMHFSITWIKDENILIQIIDTLLELNPQLLNFQSISLVKNDASYTLNGKEVKYKMMKRSNWTPLMYAVMMRKNKVAKHLIKKGANKTISGLDNVSVDEIIKERCDAYLMAITPASSAASGQTPKQKYLVKARTRIVQDLINEIRTKYAY